MLTLFAIPKPFRGHVGAIQRNAIKSWTLLRPACQIILFGNEEGTAEVAKKYGAHHVPEVVRNDFGTPLLDSAFAAAERAATNNLLCYVNTDIILMSDFTAAATRLVNWEPRFLMIGRRWDVDIGGPWDFDRPGWEERLRSYVSSRGILCALSSDYFMSPRGLWQTLPPFAVGRPWWDNWMIFRARSLGVPVVDATGCVTAVHQTHDYLHLPAGEASFFGGPEGKSNLSLVGSYERVFTVGDATHILTRHSIASMTQSDLKAKRAYNLSRVLIGVGVRHYSDAELKQARKVWGEAVRLDPSALTPRLLLWMGISFLGPRMLLWARRMRDRLLPAVHARSK